MKKKFEQTKFWSIDNLNLNDFPLVEAMEFAITDRGIFILLYIIDPDLVIYKICKEIRENRINTGIADDMLEDEVGRMVEIIFSQMFMLHKDIKKFTNGLKDKITIILSNNPNQRTMNDED